MATQNHKTYIQVIDGEVGKIVLKETASETEFLHWLRCRHPFTKYVYTSKLDNNGVDVHTTCTGFRPTYEDLVDLGHQIGDDLWELDDGRIFSCHWLSPCKRLGIDEGKWMVALENEEEPR